MGCIEYCETASLLHEYPAIDLFQVKSFIEEFVNEISVYVLNARNFSFVFNF